MSTEAAIAGPVRHRRQWAGRAWPAQAAVQGRAVRYGTGGGAGRHAKLRAQDADMYGPVSYLLEISKIRREKVSSAYMILSFWGQKL